MNLITVRCRRPSDNEDDEPRVGVTIASSADEAEGLLRNDEYMEVAVADIVEGNFPGPARLIGFTGQKAFSWDRQPDKKA
jgi:hypothetical protein